MFGADVVFATAGGGVGVLESAIDAVFSTATALETVDKSFDGLITGLMSRYS